MSSILQTFYDQSVELLLKQGGTVHTLDLEWFIRFEFLSYQRIRTGEAVLRWDFENQPLIYQRKGWNEQLKRNNDPFPVFICYLVRDRFYLSKEQQIGHITESTWLSILAISQKLPYKDSNQPPQESSIFKPRNTTMFLAFLESLLHENS